MKIEFLIPASPNDAFFSQIAFFRKSLDALGNSYANSRLVAVFGAESISDIPLAWKPYFDRVDVEWASPSDFQARSYSAQGDRRFQLFSGDADVSVICDADTALLKPLDDLVETLRQRPALAGVIAHYHFPWAGRERKPHTDWHDISTAVLGRSIELLYDYTLIEPQSFPTTPFYINYGMLAGPPAMLQAFHARDREIRPRVIEHLGPWWSPQVSLALTCADIQLPTLALPMRYNFPNDPRADQMYPDEMQRIVLLHYLRTTHFDRQTVFASKACFDEFLGLELSGSNRVFQDHVRQISAGTYPFER